MVAKKANKILKNRKHISVKTLVKLVCTQAEPAASLGFVGMSVPLDLLLDSKESIIEALRAEGFEVTEYNEKLIFVRWDK